MIDLRAILELSKPTLWTQNHSIEMIFVTGACWGNPKPQNRNGAAK